MRHHPPPSATRPCSSPSPISSPQPPRSSPQPCRTVAVAVLACGALLIVLGWRCRYYLAPRPPLPAGRHAARARRGWTIMHMPGRTQRTTGGHHGARGWRCALLALGLLCAATSASPAGPGARPPSPAACLLRLAWRWTGRATSSSPTPQQPGGGGARRRRHARPPSPPAWAPSRRRGGGRGGRRLHRRHQQQPGGGGACRHGTRPPSAPA